MQKLVTESLAEFRNISKFDKTTELYLEGKISFNDWEKYFNNLNEGKITDFINEKIVPILKSVVSKIKTSAEKAAKILRKVYDAVIKYGKKHPTLVKFIVIVIVLLLVTAVVATAATGDPDPQKTRWINGVLGQISQMNSQLQEMGFQEWDILKAQASLTDIKDGVINDPSLVSEATKNIIETAAKEIDKLNQAGGIPRSLIEIGENIINFTHDYIGNSENIKLLLAK